MPDFSANLRAEMMSTCDFAVRFELLRASRAVIRSGLPAMTIGHLYTVYEISYLKCFILWESFLEQTFLRYVCGYSNSVGTETPIRGSAFSPTLAAAKTRVFGGAGGYLLWHNPRKVITRANGYLDRCLHATVLTSDLPRLEWFAFVRHRVAHDHEDSRLKFDTATMNLSGNRFRGSRAGPFLREWTTVGGIRVRWLDAITSELCDLADQIIP